MSQPSNVTLPNGEFAGICNKCNSPVRWDNCTQVVFALATDRRYDLSDLLWGIDHPEDAMSVWHFLPGTYDGMVCNGSPSLTQYLPRYPRDTSQTWKIGYHKSVPKAWKKAKKLRTAGDIQKMRQKMEPPN